MYDYTFINRQTNERKCAFARTYEQAVAQLGIAGNEEWELLFYDYAD